MRSLLACLHVGDQSGYSALHVAAQEGHADIVALLLGPAGHVPVNTQANNGLTALHLAAQENHVALAQVLLDFSCTIDPQTKVPCSGCVCVR